MGRRTKFYSTVLTSSASFHLEKPTSSKFDHIEDMISVAMVKEDLASNENGMPSVNSTEGVDSNKANGKKLETKHLRRKRKVSKKKNKKVATERAKISLTSHGVPDSTSIKHNGVKRRRVSSDSSSIARFSSLAVNSSKASQKKSLRDENKKSDSDDLKSSESGGESLGVEDSVDDEDYEDEDDNYEDDNEYFFTDEEEDDMDILTDVEHDNTTNALENDQFVDVPDMNIETIHENDHFHLCESKMSFFGFKINEVNSSCMVLTRDKYLTPRNSPPFRLFMFSEEFVDSDICAFNAVFWMVAPLHMPFFNQIYQKKTLIVRRFNPNYYDGLFSTAKFLELLQNHNLQYGKNINVALYSNGERTTHNNTGRVYPSSLQDHLCKGRSVQCVNPQSYDSNLHYLCEILQEAFCSYVGVNNYITPANSEGFAPHWDDVDAFILQLEGRKHWTVSAPLLTDDTFPTVSSKNFDDGILEDSNRNVVFRGFLEAGDLLYIPRGFIHKAHTTSQHSHHITISVCRRFTYADSLQKGIVELLDIVSSQTTSLRKNLPISYFKMAGTADLNYTSKKEFKSTVRASYEEGLAALPKLLPTFESALVDKMVVDFMKVALPPLLTPEEVRFSCMGIRDVELLNANINRFSKTTQVRLIRRHTQRLIYENDDTAYIMHRMENSMFYDESSEGVFVNFPLEYENGFVALANAYPEWITIGKLGLSDKKARKLAKLLFKHCLLLARESTPLKGTNKTTKNKRTTI